MYCFTTLKMGIFSTRLQDTTANWVVLTNDEICCMTLSAGLKRKEDMSLLTKFLFFGKKLETVYTEYSFKHLAIADIKNVKIEELISTCRLVAECNDDKLVIFSCSFSKKNIAFQFARCVNNLLKDGNIGEIHENRADDTHCPKCGLRYPDPERKYAPDVWKKASL